MVGEESLNRFLAPLPEFRAEADGWFPPDPVCPRPDFLSPLKFEHWYQRVELVRPISKNKIERIHYSVVIAGRLRFREGVCLGFGV